MKNSIYTQRVIDTIQAKQNGSFNITIEALIDDNDNYQINPKNVLKNLAIIFKSLIKFERFGNVIILVGEVDKNYYLLTSSYEYLELKDVQQNEESKKFSSPVKISESTIKGSRSINECLMWFNSERKILMENYKKDKNHENS